MILSGIFFALYVVIVVAIGIISSRKESEEDFMIAERRVGGVQLAATMSAGFFDSAVLSLYVAYLYEFGFSAIWIFVGIILGFLVIRRFAARIKAKADEMKTYSMPEYFFRVLGKKNGLMFTIILAIQFFLFLIVNFIISGKVLSALFPISYIPAVIIGGLIVLTYLLMAGFKAVIRTDFFQLVITFVLTLTVGLFLFGRTHIPSTDLNLFQMGAGNLIGFVILGAMSVMVAPDLWQRLFAKDRVQP